MREYPSSQLEEKQELSNQYYLRGRSAMEQFGDEISELEIESVSSLFQKSLQIRLAIMHPYHPSIAHLYDAFAELYASASNYSKSAEYLENALKILKRVYGEESVEVGNEVAKLAQLYFNDQQILEAMNCVERAKLILTKHFSKDNEVLTELEEMRKVLLQAFEQTVGPYWST
jgi:tetratricopeptide (TPR) repeat protein